MPQMTGGHAVVRALRAEGVEVVFGVPGEQVMEIYDGFYDSPDIGLISTRHEQATAYMADGYARTTGKVGVALVTPGPGLYNACAALSTAYATSSPVLLISGQVDSDAIGTERNGLHQIHDQLEIVKPVTKWSHRVMRVEEIPEALHEAMRQLQTGRPRPVELEIPQDLLARTADMEILEPGSYPPPSAGAGDVRAATELLAGAAHPVIWAGGGVNISGASEELRELAELLNAPVLTTPEGKGAISDAHPLAIGLTGAPGAVSAAAQVLPQADVVLAVGTRFAVPPTAGWALNDPQKLV
ncbi:MAG: thiamine pyrophosphate-binding protein, partial [Chloroflexi bacterium]|nr:thiamine pyrophosphate-binding protein [Chloroflexota bacterium]